MSWQGFRTAFCPTSKDVLFLAGFSHRVLSDFHWFHGCCGFVASHFSEFRGFHVFAGFSHRGLSDFRGLHVYAGFSHRVLSDPHCFKGFWGRFRIALVRFLEGSRILQVFRIALGPIVEDLLVFAVFLHCGLSDI
jgi:hypothetical protein